MEELTQAGHSVTVLHRSSSAVQPLKALGVELKEVSLEDEAVLARSIPEGVDWFFHTAANTSMWRKKNAEQYRDNVETVARLARICRLKKVGRFIHTSSVAAFGLHSDVVTESTPSNALQIPVQYFRTKYLGEKAVLDEAERGLPAVVLNPAHILGQYDQRNWAQLFRMLDQGKLPGLPGGVGDFACVREVARAHIRAAQVGKLGSRYILAGPQASYAEFAQVFLGQLGRTDVPRVLPKWVLQIAASWDEGKAWLSGREPELTREKALFTSSICRYDDSFARKELGYLHRPLPELIRDTWAAIQ